MTLMLHRGAQEIALPALASLPVPAPTHSHVPLPHHELVEMVKYALGYFGHEIADEHYGVTEDGARFFGLLSLRSNYGLYTDTLGLRNSHDKSMPIGLAFGSRVFVCDNMAFNAEQVVKRKHTANSRRELPAIIHDIVQPLQAHRELQMKKLAHYRETPLSDQLADHTIMSLFRKGVIGVQKIADVAEQWDRPKYEEWGDKTAWRLFNAATYALSGKVAETPSLTRDLHTVIDGVCETVTVH